MGRTFNNQEIADEIMSEGLGYTVLYSISPDNIEDERLRKLFITAFNALNEIEIELEEYLD